MLQPHSLLWHYLWLGPHVLQAALAFLLWRRRLHRTFPIFFTYAIFEAVEEFTLYAMDVLPAITAREWWLAFCAGVVLEGILRLAVVGELLLHLLGERSAIARLGVRLFAATGVGLACLALVAAAHAPIDHRLYIWSYRGYVLHQSFYIVQGGLVLFLFLFVAYCKLTWDRKEFGIALGFGILFCERMSTWTIMAVSALPYTRYPLLDFLNMATYHVCVLIWSYFLLIPSKNTATTTPAASLPENNLDIWNRELERLLQ
jgi:hypothetical protein